VGNSAYARRKADYSQVMWVIWEGGNWFMEKVVAELKNLSQEL